MNETYTDKMPNPVRGQRDDRIHTDSPEVNEGNTHDELVRLRKTLNKIAGDVSRINYGIAPKPMPGDQMKNPSLDAKKESLQSLLMACHVLADEINNEVISIGQNLGV